MSLIKPLFWLSAIVMTIASLVPVTLLPGQVFDIWDKAQHAVAFAWLALLAGWSYPGKPLRVAACLMVYGGAIELAQAATGWRYGEWADLAADGVGTVLGMLIVACIRGKPSRTAH